MGDLQKQKAAKYKTLMKTQEGRAFLQANLEKMRKGPTELTDAQKKKKAESIFKKIVDLVYLPLLF